MSRRIHLPWAARPARPDGGRAGGAVRGSGDPDAWLDDGASPPECPPGWRTGPPDFVGVGAQKAGTTWWFKLLTAHPDVHETEHRRPELHFFDRFVTGWPGPDDVERYHRFFPRPPGSLAGEKTPNYMACHWVPRMLRDAAPETRPIVLLRDPIARYVSGRTHGDARLARVHGSVRDPANEVRWVSDAFAKGLYAQQLGWLYAVFPRDQVLVLQYERCVADPAGELARTYAFLGLDQFEPPADEIARPRNVTRREKLELEPERRTMLVDLYRDDVAQLATLVPDIDLALWPDFS